MSEMLFTDYKNKAAELQRFAPETDEDARDVLRILRRAHGVRLEPEHAASVVDMLFIPGHVMESEARVTLTEAGEVAMAQRDALRAADAALSLPVSSPVSAPEPLPELDPCSDDEPEEPFSGGSVEVDDLRGSNTGKPPQQRPIDDKRKVAKK